MLLEEPVQRPQVHSVLLLRNCRRLRAAPSVDKECHVTNACHRKGVAVDILRNRYWSVSHLADMATWNVIMLKKSDTDVPAKASVINPQIFIGLHQSASTKSKWFVLLAGLVITALLPVTFGLNVFCLNYRTRWRRFKLDEYSVCCCRWRTVTHSKLWGTVGVERAAKQEACHAKDLSAVNHTFSYVTTAQIQRERE